MSPLVAAALISGAISLIGTIAVYKQTNKGNEATNRLSERVVDREDFEAVMTRMENSLKRADERIADLERGMEAEVKAREEADARATRADERAAKAEERATRLERRVAQLEQVLRDNDIEVPPLPAA